MTITCSHLSCEQDDGNKILCRRSLNSQSCVTLWIAILSRWRALEGSMPTIGNLREWDSHRKYLKNLDKVTSTGMQMPFYEITEIVSRVSSSIRSDTRCHWINGPKLAGVLIEQFEFIFSFGIKLYPLQSFFLNSLNCNTSSVSMNKFAHHTYILMVARDWRSSDVFR